jgi:demethylmenaquinone methyltransferase/2-methoxy-6-polyprenyl-1,4-benzoquinol methylase
MARPSVDRAMESYYEARSGEYDDWYLGTGLFAKRDRPGWDEEVARLIRVVSTLPAATTLDVACGTGFLTRHLPGRVVGVDASAGMLAESRRRHSHPVVRADAFRLPFADGAFDRTFSGHFYGHLSFGQRERFLTECRRLAPSLVVVDARIHPAVRSEQVQPRTLNDGSVHRVFKRYFTAAQLVDELRGRLLYEGRWFLVVETSR